jgi:predicted Abi (CAAX) family protease
LVAVTFDSEVQDWLAQNPEQARRFGQLMKLGKSIKHKLLPFGTARADWQTSENTLGISPEEDAFEGLLIGLGSWRTMLPRLASETITKLFIEQGASVWVLRTNQVGGYDPDIEPIAPTPIGW